MTEFVLRRVLSGVLLIALLTFLTYFVFNEIPTNPACLVVACGPHTTTTDAMIRDADHQLGIDRPVYVQYGHFVWQLVRHGNFGSSWTAQQKVRTMIGDALPVTASLVGGGMLLMLLLAVPLGSLAATRPRSPVDRTLLGVSIVGIAIHPFVLGITIEQWVGTHLHVTDFSYCPLTGSSPTGCGGPVDWAGHLAVPWLVFALLFLPIYMRMIRVRLLETLGEPWVSTARAKGASESRVVFKHAMRNAIGPVLPMLAIDAGTAITAAIYVETVFGLQGIGSLAVKAFSGAQGGFDLPLTVGIVTVVGAFVVLLNVASDVAGAWLDPRVRSKSSSGLIPLPAYVAERPRLQVALNVALGAVLVGLLGLAIFHGGNGPATHVDPGKPLTTMRLGWDDFYRLEGSLPPTSTGTVVTGRGELEMKVSRVDFGPHGWRAHASVANESAFTVSINATTPAGTLAAYPLQPFSLVIQTDTGTGTKYLKPLPARDFVPALPTVLKPHQSWRGTFAGSDPVPHGVLFYAGFGQFNFAGQFGGRAFSTSSVRSAKAP
jgi:peptide/nickel transport system permease protein